MRIFELHIFGLTIAPTYYGLAYALGILGAYLWIKYRRVMSEAHLDFLALCVVSGIICGGRLGYIVFYDLAYYLAQPLKMLAIYEWGMSFHGGIIGVVLGLAYFAYRTKTPLLLVGDEVAITIPIGIWLGRIANFLNNELVGYAGYTGPLGMFKDAAYHFPSPLLESFLEGFVLLWILIYLRSRSSARGILSGAFLALYGLMRIFVEAYFRLPDPQVGLIYGLSMGQILSIPLVLIGAGIIVYASAQLKLSSTPPYSLK